MKKITLLVLCALIQAGTAAAEVIHVPADQPTIQAGIDAAVNGDTVLVADGIYTGPGNRDIIFSNKEITVRAEHGPETCIIDCEGSESEQHQGFIFQTGVGRNSILEGFTIRGGDRGNYEYGGGIECVGQASPTILGNIITENRAYFGAGISVGSGSPLIAENRITDNVAVSHPDSLGAGGGICCGGFPEVVGNIISGNLAGVMGGGVCCLGSDNIQLMNNLIVWNRVELDLSTSMAANGGGVGCYGCEVTITNCTIAMNQVIDPYAAYGHGGGLSHGPPEWNPLYQPDTVTVANSIIFGNSADFGNQCHVGWTMSGPNILSLDFSDVEGGETAVSNSGTLIWGAGMIDANPLFTPGPLGDWYLAQTAAGQHVDSPCVDSGNSTADLICYDDGSGPVCLDQLFTRTDQVADAGMVDMGYHYPSIGTVAASISCVPSAGTLPFATTMEVELANMFAPQTRRVAGRIDIQLADGGLVGNWRSGYANIGGGQSYTITWAQYLPSLVSLVGDNLFTILAADVTPAPYNQPPYPPAGDVSTDSCMVTGIAP